MPTKFLCPKAGCGKASTGSESLIGKSVRCKHCGYLFVAQATLEARASETQAKEKSRSSQSLSAIPLASSTASIGRFVIRQMLGAGAFGTVYRAFDPQLDREVAIKVPNPGVLDNPRRVERFLREARAAANLRHPHIVPVFEAGQDVSGYYIASAFIDGQQLADAIEEGGMELRRAAKLARELAEALAYAHEQGIVHRDVKPANCMLDQNDRLHLMDFGLAARADEEARLTNDGAIMGTPSYMAPEQAAGQQGEAQPASDQYAVGVVLYELLTGKVPFSGPVASVIHNVMHTLPESPKKHRPYLPIDLETICLKAMAKGVKDRYADCRALADDLRRWQEAEPIAARQLGRIERVGRWAKKNQRAAIFSGLAILMLVSSVLACSAFAIQATIAKEQARNEAKRADEEAETARAALLTAEQERQRADEEAAKSQRQKEDENQLRQESANRNIAIEKGRVDEARRRTRKLEYANAMLLAQYAWGAEADARLKQLLAAQIPGPNDEDCRGFEWYYWQRLTGASKDSNPGQISIKELLTLKGHNGPIDSVCFSPDGSKIATGSSDKTVIIWDSTTGNILQTLRGHTGSVTSIDFDRDGSYLVTGSSDNTERTWNVISGMGLRNLPPHPLPVEVVKFSPDGSEIASASRDGSVRIYNSTSGVLRLRVNTDGQPAYALAYSPDGTKISSGGSSGKALIWDTKNETKLLSIDTGQKSVFATSFDVSGKFFLTASSDGSFNVFQADTGAVIDKGKWTTDIVSLVTFSPDGKYIMSSDVSGSKVRIHEIRNTKLRFELDGHTSRVRAACFNPSGTLVATGSSDTTAKIWRLVGSKGNQPDNATGSKRVDSTGYYPTFSPDGDLAVSPGPRSILAWEVETRNVKSKKAGETEFRVVSFSPDGRYLAIGRSDGAVKVWDKAMNEIHVLSEGGGKDANPILALSYSLDGKRIAAGRDKGITIWDAQSGVERRSFKAHAESLAGVDPTISSLAFSQDGKTILSASWDGAKIWDAAIGREMLTFKGHMGRVHSAAFSFAGNRVVTGGEDNTIRIWDASTGGELLTLRGHLKRVKSVCFSPDGKRVVSASEDRTVKVWDAELGLELLTFYKQTEKIQAVSFSPDGTRIALTSPIDPIQVWDSSPASK